MPGRFRDAVAETICTRQVQLAIGIGIFSVLALMMGVSLSVTEAGSASNVVAAVNVVTLAVLIGVCVVLIAFCQLSPGR